MRKNIFLLATTLWIALSGLACLRPLEVQDSDDSTSELTADMVPPAGIPPVPNAGPGIEAEPDLMPDGSDPAAGLPNGLDPNLVFIPGGLDPNMMLDPNIMLDPNMMLDPNSSVGPANPNQPAQPDEPERVTFVSPSSPLVRLRGRIDIVTNPNIARLAYPGAALGTQFEGSSLRITAVEESLRAKWTGTHAFNIIIDNGPSIVVQVGKKATTTVVASNLRSGVHTVWVQKRTDASAGVVDFLGFQVDPKGTFVGPPPAPAHRVEFVGDSRLSGYGVNTGGNLCVGLKTDSMDARNSYPQMAGLTLDAEVMCHVYSGKGIFRNVRSSDTNATLPDMYTRTLPDAPEPEWDFSASPSEVVVIDAGGNDMSTLLPIPDVNTLGTAYYKFVRQVRRLNPKATIICARSAQAGTDYNSVLTRSIQYAVNQSNTVDRDPNVIYYAFPLYPASAGLGCTGHPSVAGNTVSAKNISEFIKTRMRW